MRVNVIDPFWISSLAEPREEVAPVETGGDSGIRPGVVSNAPLPGHGVCQWKKSRWTDLEDSLGREFVAPRHAVPIHLSAHCHPHRNPVLLVVFFCMRFQVLPVSGLRREKPAPLTADSGFVPRMHGD